MSVKEPLQPNCNFAWVKADNTRLTKEELHNQRRQDMNEKPEALRLAELLNEATTVLDEPFHHNAIAENCDKAAAELRRLYAENERLLEALNRFEYSSDGHIKRYPEEEEVIVALRREETT